MGVTINYRGKLKSPESIEELTDEVLDICNSNGWRFDVFDDGRFGKKAAAKTSLKDALMEGLDEDFTADLPDLGLRGIMFSPDEESEWVSLLFDAKGRLKSIISVLFPEIQAGKKMPWAFTKTQFAGIEAHKQIIHLLEYVKKKYFSRFDIDDHGGYYPDHDEATLTERMGLISSAMETIEDIFQNANFEGSPEEVAEQIQDALTRSLKNMNIKVIKFDPNEDGSIEDHIKKLRKKDDDETKE